MSPDRRSAQRSALGVIDEIKGYAMRIDSPLPPLVIREDDLSGAQIRGLLELHLRQMHLQSPAGSVFALNLDGLKAKDVTVYSAWRGAQIAGVGALKQHNAGLGELKSMRTHPDHVRQGVAQAILEHIIDVAKERGCTRLSL